MIIEIKGLFREARWFWVMIAATMLTGTGVRMFLRGTKGSRGETIALVDGEELSSDSFRKKLRKEEAMREQLRQWGIQMGPVSNKDVFKNCVKDLLLNGITSSIGLRISDAELSKHIKKSLPKALFDEQGKLDVNMYEKNIKYSQGCSVMDFEEDHRMSLEREMVSDLLTDAVSFGKSEKHENKDQDGERNIEVLRISLEKIKNELNEQGLNEDQVLAYYEKNKKNYQTKGSALLKVVRIDKVMVKDGIVVSEKEIADQYERVKYKKYATEKTYTTDFWVFEKNALEDGADKDEDNEDNIVDSLKEKEKIKNFVEQCLVEKLEDDFKACEQKALENNHKLQIIRNHNISLGSGNFSRPIEKAIRELSTEGSISDCVEVGDQIYVVRLVKKEGSKMRALAEVKDELLENIRSKKVEYEVSRLATSALKKIKEVKPSSIDSEFLKELVEVLGVDNEILSFEEINIGDGSVDKGAKTAATLVDALSGKLDGLEKGKVGRVADDEQEIIYAIDNVVKKKTKDLSEVREEVEDDCLKSLAEIKMFDLEKKIKSSLLANGSWPDEFKDDVEFLEKIDGKKLKTTKFSDQISKKILGLSSSLQVLSERQEISDGMELIIAKLTEDLVKEVSNSEVVLEIGEVGLTEILDGLAESVRIESYIDVQ